MPTSFQDLLLAFEFVGNSVGEHQAVLCRRTGKIHWRSEFSDLDEFNDELPDDIEDEAKRGAYRKFRTLLIRRNALDRWYDFESKAIERALREWCEFNSIAVAG